MRPGNGARLCRMLGAFLVLLLIQARPGWAMETPRGPLVFGVLPYAAPGALFKRFAPLRNHLNDRLTTRVELETARNFATFIERTDEGQYGMVLTAPHLALAAEARGPYEIGARTTGAMRAVVVIPSVAGAKRVETLPCATIATPPETAIATLMGRDLLLRRLPPEGELPTFRVQPTHASVVHAVLDGDACAGVLSGRIWRQYRHRGAPLRPLAWSKRVPGPAVLLHRALPERVRERILRILVALEREPEERAPLRRTTFQGFHRASRADFVGLRPYLYGITLPARSGP
ncbi:phosphate/phosphite/phosphonate ABC transporter substrate-binding protein [Thiohalorhabdus methylotrophus]|uniref:Phosphate/phosphite/phosphonate ABC transporter substrate-binding protein n=1 Tax=Thiohalorhabdus methylotrophus TaxID=3242694 RepID=A0ABV4TXF7_9GAMM